MISRFRVGNTLEVALEVLTNGEAVSLDGRDISVILVGPRKKERMMNWHIDSDYDNVVRFVFEGRDQKDMGVGMYHVVVYENKDGLSQTLFDKTVFSLVPKTSMAEFADEGLAHGIVELSGGSLLVGGKDGVSIVGLSQVSQSSVSLGENVWRATLSNGDTFNFVVKNGEKGEKGDAGDAVYVKRVYKNYDYIGGIQYVMEFSDGSAFPFVSPRGDKGEDGKTPQRGVDYWTEADQAAVIAAAILGLDREIPTKTSQLDNDSNFISDEDYTHTDENFTSTEKNKLAGIAAGAQVNYVKSVEDYSNTAVQSNYSKFLSQGGITLKISPAGLLGLMVNTGGIVGPSAWGSGTRQFVTGQAVYNFTSNNLLPKENPSMSGVPTAPTAPAGTNTRQVATTEFVQAAIAAMDVGSASFKGEVNSASDLSSLENYKAGWNWLVKTAGTYVGQMCEAGDMIYCISDFSSSYDAADFTVIQANIASAYHKPDSGIPKTDLSSEVQTSLGKADSAYAAVAAIPALESRIEGLEAIAGEQFLSHLSVDSATGQLYFDSNS